MVASNLRYLCLLMTVVGITNAKNHAFEFGDVEQGQEYYVKEGTIHAFSYDNTFDIPGISEKMLTGVKVVVSGLSTPQVTFNKPTVSIQYKFPQWTYSNYKIIANGHHRIGEVQSLTYEGIIPAFARKHIVNVSHDRTDVETKYTYLSLVTMTIFFIGAPVVSFDQDTNILTLRLYNVPLMPVFFAINGFSMPLKYKNTTQFDTKSFRSFWIRAHKMGDVKSFELNDTIPPYVPIHRVNITHGRTDVEARYTYVKVETLTIAAQDPNVIFDPVHNLLTFFIRYPLYTVSFAVIGYSMPLKAYTGMPEIVSATENASVHHLTLPSDLPERKYT